MSVVEKIIKSKKKPKEIVSSLSEALIKNNNLLSELIGYFEKGTKAEKGHCIEAIEYVTKENPEIVQRCFDFIIEHINDKEPRIKWEASRIIGNVAHKFPDKMKKVVPMILANTKDKGIVVRWSSAYALTEIAKSNPTLRNKLNKEIREIVEREKNNGVRNIYLKYLKSLVKEY